ncbi:MAG: hypothetical protein HRU78_12775 [Gammaproteobacteria bacterium]|nr:MAG: hypothetical protein HRU78_12775 [Gammaproteobacteria bacterium]
MGIFGWVLHLGRCAYLDDDSVVLSVNFVMPAGEPDLDSWNPEHPPGLPKARWSKVDAIKRLGDLLYPWQWEIKSWKLVKLDANGKNLKECEVNFVSGCLPIKDRISPSKDSIWNEIENETKEGNCENVFSADAKYATAESGGKSFPHLFAPLTHLPAGISNEVLQLAGFLKIGKKEREGLGNEDSTFLVAFPIFKAKEKLFEPQSYKLNIGDSIAIAECTYQQDSSGVKVCFLQNALKATDSVEALEDEPIEVNIQTHQKSDFVYEAELRTYLHPIQLLSMGLGKLNQLNIELSSLKEELMTLKTFPGSDPAKIKEKEEEIKKKEEEIKDEKDFFPKLLTPESLKTIRKRIVSIFGWGWDRIDAHVPSENPRPNTNPHILDYFFHEEKPIAWLNNQQWFVLKNILASKKIDELNDNDNKTIIARYSTFLEKLRLKDWGDNLKIWTNDSIAIDSALESLQFLSNPNALTNEFLACAAWHLNVAGWIVNVEPDPKPDSDVEKIIYDALWKSEFSARMVRLFWEKGTSAQFKEWFRNHEKINDHAPKIAEYLCEGLDEKEKINTSVIENIIKIAALLSEKENVQAENKDTGLTLAIKEEAKEAEIRGFAITLRAGFKGIDGEMKWDDSRAKWITDTHCVVLDKERKLQWLEVSKSKLVLHETVGATLDHGNLVASFLYNGGPVASIPADKDGKAISDNIIGEDLDGTNCLDFRWFEDKDKKESQLPLLGYGLYYQAIATAIDNAGGIKATRLRNVGNYTELNNTDAIFTESRERVRYLSHEAPKALSVQPKATTEKSHLELALSCHEESIVNLYLKNNEEIKSEKSKSTQVYMLCPAEANDNDSHYSIEAIGLKELTFEIGSPDADADFITRWMNTEIFLAEQKLGQLRKEPFNGADSEKLIAFRDLRVKERKQNKVSPGYKPYIPFHPAVTHIGMKFEYLSKGEIKPIANIPNQSIPVIEKINFDNENKEIIKYRVELKITSVAGNIISVVLKSKEDKNINIKEMTLSIPNGTQVKVSYYCLIPNWMYRDSEDSIARFFESDQFDIETFKGFHALFSAEQWFEVLPKDFLPTQWFDESSENDLPTLKNHKLIELELKDEKSDAFVLSASVSGDDNNAIELGKWTLGGYLERHEWHWTGYAVDFPSDNGLDQWLIRHTGVESYRESIDFEFETIWSEKKEKQQILKNGPITRLTLPDSRPGRYVAYTMRPRLHYQRWLNPLNKYVKAWSDTVFASGRIIPGSAIDATKIRLPIPALKWAIPMTMTLDANAQQNDHIPPRIENGNLLVLDDAIYRTDALARFGGIGERIEIDVVETRFSETLQQGVNPIFHSREKTAFKIKSLDSFGLTYDQGRNAKVAQTSLVVVPEGANGKWVMSQVKLRRLIEPHSISGSVINEEDEEGKKRRSVALRKIGDEVVPEDFCIQFSFDKDSSQEVSITISVRKNDEKTNAFTVTPSFELQKKGTYRFLCSWHKGRWDKSDPSWRMRVALQTQRLGLMHWDTSEIQSCFVLEKNWEHTISSGSDKYYLSMNDISKDVKELEVQRIALSDYTEPLWLTFIGSFGQQPIGRPDEYILRKGNSKVDSWLLSYKDKTDIFNWVLWEPPPKREFYENTVPKKETDESYIARQKWWDYSKNNKTTFQLLFVYRPTADINRGSIDTSTGEFIGLFAPDIGTGNAWAGTFTPWHPVSIELQAGDYAYLRSFQRINVNWPELKTDDPEEKKSELKSKLPALETWENLIEEIFRNDKNNMPGGESTIRPLPEILGPIRFDFEK